jgi:hypothetical protein
MFEETFHGGQSMRRLLRAATAVGVAGIIGTLAHADASAQKTSPADLASKLSGTWILNRELSTGFR